MAISIEEMATFCKAKGFIYPTSEIYGGFAGFYDFGPLGVELKNAIKQSWWKRFVQSRQDVAGMDGTIISHPKVWVASGHVECFEDVLVEDTVTKERFRADHLVEDALKTAADGLSAEDLWKLIQENDIKSPKGNPLSAPQQFNLMFSTNVGPIQAKENLTYLRPETAQHIFSNFRIIADTNRMQLPFGIAQTGKAFRNEISPRDFLFRVREFEQMELEFFIHPEQNECPLLTDADRSFKVQINTVKNQDEKQEHGETTIGQMIDAKLLDEWHGYWLKNMYQWFLDLGIKYENLRLREHLPKELAHYATACFDIEYKFPFGWKEIHGMANRQQFDLEQHQKVSKKSMELFDEASKKKVIPRVIEPSQGVDRAFLAFMFDAYENDEKRGNAVLKLHPKIAPVQVGVFPLVNKIKDKAKEVYDLLKDDLVCFYDQSGSVGRRYARADELGVPVCITIDFDNTMEKDIVTVRERDSTEQVLVPIAELKEKLSQYINGACSFSELGQKV